MEEQSRTYILEASDLSVSFETDAGEVQAVRDVSLSLKEGEVLAIVGESGCGKSVLCKSLMKMLPGNANKEQVLALAEKDVDYTKPEDIIKDPYVFEFLGLPEEKPFLESDLEAALVRQIEDFLLELGRGFMFVGTHQRVTVNNTHYYVDMVFYSKILHAYVLIELKTTKLTPEAAGQINMYLNY